MVQHKISYIRDRIPAQTNSGSIEAYIRALSLPIYSFGISFGFLGVVFSEGYLSPLVPMYFVYGLTRPGCSSILRLVASNRAT
ncbi:hypothetical protein RJT34_04885 [Clitoria ternatea]|uniref:Uncharacterized protein n=1 Tax=Clitoria ternatea TaxID=43366 RepID=A0AAN9Q2P3_CLITE